ncbi:hypothetical protein BDW68DRAFT_155906 [Aspergillus falconensis]
MPWASSRMAQSKRVACPETAFFILSSSSRTLLPLSVWYSMALSPIFIPCSGQPTMSSSDNAISFLPAHKASLN